MGMACAAPFDADTMYAEVTRAAPYASLVRSDFDDVLRFVADGGYALGGYERYRRLTRTEGGRYRPASPRVVQRYRMNIGTIVEAVMLKVRLRRGPVLGEIEEYFVQGLDPGDTFIFAGRMLRFEALRRSEARRGGREWGSTCRLGGWPD